MTDTGKARYKKKVQAHQFHQNQQTQTETLTDTLENDLMMARSDALYHQQQLEKFKTEYFNGLETLQEQLKDKTGRLNALSTKHMELYEENEKLKKQLHSNHPELDEYCDKIQKQYETECDLASQLIENKMELKEAYNKSKVLNSHYEAVIKALEADITELKGDLETAYTAEDLNLDLQKKMNEENESFGDTIERLMKDNNELKIQILNLEVQRDIYKNGAEYQEYKDLNIKKDKIEKELLSMKQKCHSACVKLEKAEDELDDFKLKNDHLEKEVERLTGCNELYLDKNMRYTKKELIAMMSKSQKEFTTEHEKLNQEKQFYKENYDKILRQLKNLVVSPDFKYD